MHTLKIIKLGQNLTELDFLAPQHGLPSATLRVNSLRTFQLWFGSPARTRTADLVVNSHSLCQLSYWGI